MRFPYHQIDDDSIEPAGNIQEASGDQQAAANRNDNQHRNDDLEDLPSPSLRQLLPHWPFILGIFQIIVGFLCAIFGIVVVAVLPFVINVEAELGLNRFNAYGAALWSGVLLVISGSLAVRTAKQRSLLSVQQFYMMTLFSFLANAAFLILILYCYMHMFLHQDMYRILGIDQYKQDIDATLQKCTECTTDPDIKCTDEETAYCAMFDTVKQCSSVNLVAAVWCLFGCLLLFLSTVNYFRHVFFGEVRLLKTLGVCWLPCWFYSVPSQASSYQSVNSDYSMQNAII